MQDSADTSNAAERKKKQAYLITHVIEQGYEPDAFSQFLSRERAEGENVDNWSLEDLETMVQLFIREESASTESGRLRCLMQDIDLDASESLVYAKRVKTARKKRTVLTDMNALIIVEGSEVKDGGLFSGKYVCFTIRVPELEMRVRRTDADCRWLAEHLAREQPFTPLPPINVAYDKNSEADAAAHTRKCLERFLNACAAHPQLRNSLALEIFLTSQTKEEFGMRCKDVHAFFSKNVLLHKALTKKGFEGLNKDPLPLFPTPKGTAEVKISPGLRDYVKSAEGQMTAYAHIFEKLEKLAVEYDKAQSKLADISGRVRDTLSDLQATAARFNGEKPYRTKYGSAEEPLYASLAAYFDADGWLSRTHTRRAAVAIRAAHRRVFAVHARAHSRTAVETRTAQFGRVRVPKSEIRARREEK